MLFAYAFRRYDLLNRIRRFRDSPTRVYGTAFVMVAVATLVRLLLHRELSTTAPFATYALAMLCIALAGGFWPGMVTLAVSLITGAILFLPPVFSLTLADGAGWTLSMFALFGTINVTLVSGLFEGILLHDERQQFLLAELRHRSRNLFTVVQRVVSRTLAESETLSEAGLAVGARLTALARTHGMLADSDWIGAPLDRMISEELTSFASQVSCTGCDLVLNTPAAQAFALIIHELATNALKHGALSRPEGHVTIQGLIQSRKGSELFRFLWTETEGPVVELPRRKGFGSSILGGMAKQFADSVEVTYRPEGLTYELQMPLTSIQASKARSMGMPAKR